MSQVTPLSNGTNFSPMANKKELINSIAEQWTREEYVLLVGDKEVHMTTKSKCISLPLLNSCEIPELKCTQEEAYTRLLLHAQHASCHYGEVIIYTPDTDVFVIALAFKDGIDANLYIKTGVKSTKRIISLNSIDDYICNNTCNAECNPRDFHESLDFIASQAVIQ